MRKSIYDFEVNTLSGKPVRLSAYKGKVLLIVNIASACGLTPQLGGLEEIYAKYKKQGFEVLAFPSNQFAGQEPLKGEAIEEFCSVNYGVQFPVFEKGKVKGPEAQPLFHFLAEETKQLFIRKNYPVWNFQKYLIDRNGKVVDYFTPWTTPNSDKLAEQIEACLAEKVTKAGKTATA